MPLIVREATAADIEKFSPRFRLATIRGLVGDLDGEIITLGGLTLIKGRWYAFLDIKDGAFDVPGYRIALMRAGKRVMAMARELNIRFLYVEPDASEHGAVRWLTSLGFAPYGSGSHIYRWKACQD